MIFASAFVVLLRSIQHALSQHLDTCTHTHTHTHTTLSLSHTHTHTHTQHICAHTHNTSAHTHAHTHAQLPSAQSIAASTTPQPPRDSFKRDVEGADGTDLLVSLTAYPVSRWQACIVELWRVWASDVCQRYCVVGVCVWLKCACVCVCVCVCVCACRG